MKISLCVTCMNRLRYLKQTIHKNIIHIKEFNMNNIDQYEYVLVNYDSKDKLHDYMSEEFDEEIESGLIKYIKIEDKKYFHVMHAKNIAHRYSSGEVLINLDSDNLVSDEILKQFAKIFTVNDKETIFLKDNHNIGLLGFSRSNFYKLGGYDESMKGYGAEDVDIRQRGFAFLNLKAVKLPSHIDHHEDYVIQQTFTEKTYNHEYIGGRTIENGYTLVEKLFDMNKLNNEIKLYNLVNKITNPNEHNKIEFGKI